MCRPETDEPIKKQEEKKKERSSGEPMPKKEKVSELYNPGEYYLKDD